MVDEFEVILEDDSPYLIAKHLVELYGQCVNGNHAEVDRLREKFKTQNQFAASNCVKQSGDDDSDDDDNNQVMMK
jgi:pre-rRNA-processing protein TSR2